MKDAIEALGRGGGGGGGGRGGGGRGGRPGRPGPRPGGRSPKIWPRSILFGPSSSAELECIWSADGNEIVACYDLFTGEDSDHFGIFDELPRQAELRYRPLAMGCWSSYTRKDGKPKLLVGAERDLLAKLAESRSVLMPESQTVVEPSEIRGLALGLLDKIGAL